MIKNSLQNIIDLKSPKNIEQGEKTEQQKLKMMRNSQTLINHLKYLI